jgi:nitrogen PTS system EIIA component
MRKFRFTIREVGYARAARASHVSAHSPAAAGSASPRKDEPTSVAPTRLAEWLQPQEVILDLPGRDRKDVLEAAALAIGRTHGLQSAPIFDALWRREQAGCTALGAGFAIPHARVIGIPGPLTVYLRTRAPVPFGAPDGKPVSDFLVILVPSDGSHDDHLQLLALVARLFSDKRFRRQIHEASDAAVVSNAFRRGIESAIHARR